MEISLYGIFLSVLLTADRKLLKMYNLCLESMLRSTDHLVLRSTSNGRVTKGVY